MMVSYFKLLTAATGSTTLSYFRIPLVLYAVKRSIAIVFDMAQSWFNSFSLDFLESKEGQRMFREDYDLITDASLHCIGGADKILDNNKHMKDVQVIL